MSSIKRVLPLFIVTSLLTVVASCVDSHNPASDKKTSKIDERLIGQWKDESNDLVWKVAKSKDTENALEVNISAPDAPESWLAFTTTINSKSYLSMQNNENTEKMKPEDMRYDIYQYEISDKDTVLLRVMDPKVIMKAIRDKQIAGKIDKDEDDDEDTPEITDTTEGIVRYLEAHADECYPKKSDYTMTFKRKI